MAHLQQTRRNNQFIVQAGRAEVANAGFGHDKHAARTVAQTLLLHTQCSELFGAGTFKKFQVVGIKNDAAGVGVFPIDTQRPSEFAW
jgi:hypothetical protein